MSLIDVIDTIGTFGLAGIAVVGAFAAGYAHCYFTRCVEDVVNARNMATKGYPTLVATKEVKEETQLRSVKEAISFGPDTRSIVKGVVDFWTPASDGYVGNLRDNSGKAPFYVCEDNINPFDGRWVVPVLLEHSLRKEQPITMEVDSPDGLPILIVRGIDYAIDGQKYTI